MTFTLSDDRWVVRFVFRKAGSAMRFLECREEFFQRLDGGVSYREVAACMMVKCWEVV